jgi:hypothetical protein
MMEAAVARDALLLAMQNAAVCEISSEMSRVMGRCSKKFFFRDPLVAYHVLAWACDGVLVMHTATRILHLKRNFISSTPPFLLGNK